MRKLKLQVEDLEVVSFQTDEASHGRGTVAGHLVATPTEEPTCGDKATCDVNYATCNDGHTCVASCDGVCGSYMYTDCALCISAQTNCQVD